jgi:uncharacterized protein YjbJ (UPF0337 family)
MSRDVIKSQWTRLPGKLRSKWGKLTYEDVNCAEGDRDYLSGKLQERYGIPKAEAQLLVQKFERLMF